MAFDRYLSLDDDDDGKLTPKNTHKKTCDNFTAKTNAS